MLENIEFRNIDKSNWQIHRFDEIAFSISEKVDPTNTDLEIYVGLEHIDPESIHIKRFGQQGDVKGTKLRCYPGDIIFGRRRAYQRKAAIVDFDGFCSAHSLVLRANPEIIYPNLLPFFLHSDLFMHCAIDISVGSLSPTINWKTLKHQEFLIPPKGQQAKIAELLWAMDDMVSSYKIIELKLEDLYKSISGRTFSKSVEKYYSELPFNFKNTKWIQNNLEEYCTLITDGSHLSPKTEVNGMPICTVENMRDNSINIESCRTISIDDFKDLVRNNCKPEIDDVLFSKDGTIGKTFVYKQTENIVLLSSIAIIRTKKDLLLPEYCFLIFDSPVFFNEIEKKKSGTALRRIVLRDIKQFQIRVPSIEIQKEVIAKIMLIKKELDNLKNQIIISSSLQRSLINEMFSS